MAHVYTPGLKVTDVMTAQYRRVLPIKGRVFVKAGDAVEADKVVAQADMPGDVEPVNLANLLALPPDDVKECVLKKEGETVQKGEVIARNKGLFGLFKTEVKAPADGTIEAISSITGQMMIRGPSIPVQVRAFVRGKVVEVLPDEGCVVEAEISLVQGIFGVGGETMGKIKLACSSPEEVLDAKHIRPEMKGCVVIGGARVTAEAIKEAVKVGAVAIVTGGMDDQDLRNFLGYDLGVAITGQERMGITLVLTEGFGNISMAHRTFDLLKSREGSEASVNGATQIRAGVIRPEVAIPVGDSGIKRKEAAVDAKQGLRAGLPIRVIRHPYFGKIGKVSAMPEEPTVLESGSKARILEVEFPDGKKAIVPRANVELIEG